MAEQRLHAVLSPSGAKRWMTCAGAPAMEMGLPDTSTEYSAEGTMLHDVSAQVLRGELLSARSVLGHMFKVDGFDFIFDVDHERAVNAYVKHVQDRVQFHKSHGAFVVLEVEQAVPLGHITGEEGATGTADAIIMAEYADGRMVIDVMDAKFGRGDIVSVVQNPQLMLYAAGAIEKFAMVFEPTQIFTHICQPRIENGFSREGIEPGELQTWVDEQCMPKARTALSIYQGIEIGDGASIDKLPGTLVATAEGCRWCKAYGTCPQARETALTMVTDSFVDLDKPLESQLSGALERVSNCDDAILDALFPQLDLVENWVTAVRARVEARLFAGATFRNGKLVQGRQGNRTWRSLEAAEEALKAMRIKHHEMYSYKLISPTDAEKLAKAGTIGKRQWPKLQDLIIRAPGKISVALATDPREAVAAQISASEFVDLEDDGGDLA